LPRRLSKPGLGLPLGLGRPGEPHGHRPAGGRTSGTRGGVGLEGHRLGQVGQDTAQSGHQLGQHSTAVAEVGPQLPLLRRRRQRLQHLDERAVGRRPVTYLGTETYSPANGWLIGAQAGIPLAQAWGGGLVAAVDGMRFVVPVPTVYARPNRKYFGPKRGITWLNMINDQGAGLGAKVVSGTPRDSLHMIDVVFSQDGGQRPDIIGRYRLLLRLGLRTRPAAGHGVPAGAGRPARPAALAHRSGRRLRPPQHRRPRQDRPRPGTPPLARHPARSGVRLHRHGPRLRRGPHAPARRAPHPARRGDAAYGRIFKSLHILAYVDDETYRRDIKGIRNLQEGRHSLAAAIFHGKKGELYQRYHKGMEDQLGALGLVLNCVVLWNTFYINAALEQLRAQGYPVLDDDVTRLSPFVRRHLNVHGKYSFALPELPGGLRALRDPDAETDDGDED
jgi:TnpA family transposase